MANAEGFNSLFAQFTRLRQTGISRERAWSEIEPRVLQLGQGERDRLLALLRGWEAKEGRNHQALPANDPYQTHHAPPEGLVDVLGDMDFELDLHGSEQPDPVPEPASGRLRSIKRINGAQPSSAPTQTNVCPNCGKAYRPGEILCGGCSQMLAEGMANPGSTHRLTTVANHDSAYFGETMQLALRVEGAGQVIRVRPGKSELVIGRRSPESVMIPDVDLAQYNAEAKGVSRLHAALQRHDTTLVLTDMGSLNHTYINGQRVHAHEVRVLHDGDQLQLGQLRVDIFFEYA